VGVGALAYHEVKNGSGLSRENHDTLRIVVPVLSFSGAGALSAGLIGIIWRGEP